MSDLLKDLKLEEQAVWDALAIAEASLYSINMQKTIHEEEPGRFQAFEVGISARSFHDGAQFARSIYEARLAEDAKVRAGLVEALGPLADLDDDDLNRHLTLEEIAAFRAALAAAKGIK